MKEIRVFPRITGYTPIDELVFIGSPPEKKYLPIGDYFVSISITWTWDIPKGLKLYKEWRKLYKNVKIGGPAFNMPGGSFQPGRFVRNGILFTSRGCNRKCSWCYVHKREKQIQELEIHNGFVIEDSNLLMTSEKHINSVFDMLRRNNKKAYFNGGFDTRLFNKDHLGLLESIKIGEVYFACDSKEGIVPLRKTALLLTNKSESWRLCYVLVGYKETLQSGIERIVEVKNIGFIPIVMLYQTDKFIHYSETEINKSKEFYIETDYMKLINKWEKECIDFQFARFKK